MTGELGVTIFREGTHTAFGRKRGKGVGLGEN